MNERTAGGGRVLAILVLAYIFNFVDREIVGILAVPIKAELHLSDTRIGLMIGLAFALFYTGLGIPIAWLADRRSRVRIIAASLALWSLFTGLSGAARSFAQLFVARMGVGIGEAGGVAPSYSLIADHFPPEQRGRALAVFAFGIPIGSALGLYLGGWIATAVNWRAAFAITGAGGLLVLPLVLWGIEEPVRGGRDNAAGIPAPLLLATLATLLRKPSFWLLSLGASCSSVVGYGLFAWLPSLFVRSFHMSLGGASTYYGTIILVGGLAGIWLGGWLSDRLGRGRPGAYALVPAFAWLLAIPFLYAGLYLPEGGFTFILFLVPTALSLAWLGPVTAAIQHIVPPAMRSTASAAFLFINNLIGIGFGVPFIGKLSDWMTAAHGADSLLHSIAWGLGFYGLAALLLLVAAPRLDRDWYRNP
ncbi:MAG TPA: MFS transporter [Allosphingosinicella sp.]|nr:MFS transporter [Allosphingosinicella sp.]